jgi:hypothetical protein
MGVAQRISELGAIETSLAEEPGGGWLARAIRDGLERELGANRPPTTAEVMADLISCGLSGRPLLAELWSRFAGASRADVFTAIALATAILEARLTLAETERNIATAPGAEAST